MLSIDTAEIRGQAKAVGEVAEELSRINNQIGALSDSTLQDWQGLAATEFRRICEDMANDLNQLKRGLEGIGQELQTKASLLEKADQDMASSISAKR